MHGRLAVAERGAAFGAGQPARWSRGRVPVGKARGRGPAGARSEPPRGEGAGGKAAEGPPLQVDDLAAEDRPAAGLREQGVDRVLAVLARPADRLADAQRLG